MVLLVVVALKSSFDRPIRLLISKVGHCNFCHHHQVCILEGATLENIFRRHVGGGGIVQNGKIIWKMFHPKKNAAAPISVTFQKKVRLDLFLISFQSFHGFIEKISTNYFLRLCLPIVSFCFYIPNYCPLITLAFFTTRTNNFFWQAFAFTEKIWTGTSIKRFYPHYPI